MILPFNPRKKADILHDLQSWIDTQQHPAELFTPDTFSYYYREPEISEIKKLNSMDADDVTRSNLWDCYNATWYLTNAGKVYFLPKILLLLLEHQFFPSIEFTFYNAIFSDAAESERFRQLLNEFVAELSDDQRRLLAEVLVWEVKYRTEVYKGHLEFVNSDNFKQIFAL